MRGEPAKGYRIRRIADELALNDRTVSTYKTRLMEKLGAKSLIELAEVARRNGLISTIEIEHPGSSGYEPASAPATQPSGDTHALLDTLPYAVSIRSMDGRIVFANRHLQTLLGQRGADLYDADLPQQARALGADEATARRVESAFCDTVASGVPYRVDAVGVADGQTAIGVHWGAPLLDDAGSFTKMICGTFNVSGPERMFVELRDACAATLEIWEARAAHALTFGQVIGESITRALAILDSGEGGSQADCGSSGELRGRLLVAQMHLRQLQALMASNEPRHESRTERSDVRQLTREVAATVERDATPLGIRVTTRFQGRGGTLVWVDIDGYAQLLSTLLYEAIRNAGPGATVPLRFSSTLRTGGMVDIAVEIGSEGKSPNARRDDTSNIGVHVAQTGQQLQQHMATALGAKLRRSDQTGSSLTVLTMTLLRTESNRNTTAPLDGS
ncbi:LuxR C-terminal-related transcriptional regulator [Paraburkholderia sp. BR10936]|uniref:LuxR C-terminal-related transcriptional regulator n=1 Tax=Paraburkholderia sp. BR10936 TaxID=3236993 RepID=UPI0034D229E9